MWFRGSCCDSIGDISPESMWGARDDDRGCVFTRGSLEQPEFGQALIIR